MVEGKIETRDVLIAALGVGVVGVVGLTLVVLSGVYSVSAARPHYDPTTWLLDLVRKRSIWFHSIGVDPPPLDDPGLLRLGAAHFEASCADCHGAPDRPASAIASAMLPQPPPLGPRIADWEERELFWIVQNGQKYTGMPSWIPDDREDEVWPVVAFLEALPTMSAATYRDLAGIDDLEAVTVPVGQPGEVPDLLSNCARCHGPDGATPVYASVPVIAGQSAEYLDRSLRAYRAAARKSGYMQLVAATLSDEEIAELALHFSARSADGEVPGADWEGDVNRGGMIFAAGIPEQDVPACYSCHDGSGTFGIPLLAGQPGQYLHRQLLLFKHEVRDNTAAAVIMAPIAERLTDQQMRDLAAYLASLGGPQ